MKKILISLLVLAIMIPAFTACAAIPETVATSNTFSTDLASGWQSASQAAQNSQTTESEQTEENAQQSDAVNSDTLTLTEVSIFTGETESEVYAGEELAKYLQQKNVTVQEAGAFPITLSIDSSLEDDAFVITAVTSGENAGMTIVGGNERGVLYGVYKFLEELGGVRYFMPGLETVPDSEIVISDGVVLEYTPYFESRRMNWNCVTYDAEWCNKQGINTNNADMSGKYGGSWNYGPYFVHTLGALTETGGGASTNPCLSLDSPEGQANFEKTIKNLRAALEADPTINIVSVSQNDKNVYCECEYCLASYALYTTNANDKEAGGTAGNLLVFVNKVAEVLEEDYPDLIIDTLAYNYTQSAPVGIVPRDNVCIRLCSIRVCFMHPFTECPDAKGPNGIAWTRTAKFRTDFVDWGKICDRIFIWDYTTNFAYYIAPFCNFGSMRENMRFYHENGVRGMFPQGNSQSISGEFGELRAYLLAKLMWNPYMSEEEYNQHMNEFLQAYYGAGWIYIRQYIQFSINMAADSCINIYEAPFQSITEAEYRQMDATFTGWWERAELIAGDRADAVHRSALQWRYIQLLLHPDKEACAQFVAEVEAYGIRWAESAGNNKPLNEMFTNLYPKDDGTTGDGPHDGGDPMNP